MLDETRIGASTPIATTLIEPWQVRDFAFALGDDRRPYYDPVYSLRAQQEELYAPPTFYHSFRHGKSDLLLGTLGLDFRYLLHAEQEVIYHRALKVGDRVTYRSELAEITERVGRRTGPMQLFVLNNPCWDDDGNPLLTVRETLAYFPPDLQSRQAGRSTASTATPDRTPAAGSGKPLPLLQKEPISRVQIVRYAGISGDFNPVHIDESFAVAAHRPSVWAHGMIGTGFIGQLLEQVYGPASLRRLRVRMVEMVYPGDALACGGAVTEHTTEDGIPVLHCDVWARNQHGVVTHAGHAVVKAPREAGVSS